MGDGRNRNRNHPPKGQGRNPRNPLRADLATLGQFSMRGSQSPLVVKMSGTDRIPTDGVKTPRLPWGQPQPQGCCEHKMEGRRSVEAALGPHWEERLERKAGEKGNNVLKTWFLVPFPLSWPSSFICSLGKGYEQLVAFATKYSLPGSKKVNSQCLWNTPQEIIL